MTEDPRISEIRAELDKYDGSGSAFLPVDEHDKNPLDRIRAILDRPTPAARVFSEAIKMLQDAGYLVVKIPPCKRTGRGHGSHTLITRSAMCPGEEPKPHAIQNRTLGAFGPWVHCACGESFSDYADDRPTNWEKHKQEVDQARAEREATP